MAGVDSSEALDVARSQLAAELRDPSSVGFDAETAAGVVEALFSGSMDAESVVEGLLGGDPKASAAVSRFCSAVEKRARGGGGGSSSVGASASSSSSASTYQPASLSAEAAAARAKEEASRSAAAAVAAVSTGALSAVPAGARAGRALVFKEAKTQSQSEKAAAEEASGSGKQALADKKIRSADRAFANCLFCGKIFSTHSPDAETRRLLETGRCTFPGCGARVALRAGEVSDVRPAGRPPSTSTSSLSFPSSEAAAAAASAFVDDLSRNPWLSSSERSAAIASAREADGAAAATAGPTVEEEEDEGGDLGAVLKPAPGTSSRLLFSLPPPRRQGNHDFHGKSAGSYPFEEGEEHEEKKQVIPGYYAPDEEERSRAKGKGKKRGG